LSPEEKKKQIKAKQKKNHSVPKNIGKKGITFVRYYSLQMTRKIYLPLPASASESKIKRSSRLNRSSKTNVFMMYLVLKTATIFGTSLANSSKIGIEINDAVPK